MTHRRCADLCRVCADKSVVFPAMEAFELRLENPNTYFIFYEYFLKSTVGDEAWKNKVGLKRDKENRTNARIVLDTTCRLSSTLDEAFAMVMLKNNYFAWLLKAKETFGMSLVTDYEVLHLEEEQRQDYKSLGEYITVDDKVIDLTTGLQDYNYIWDASDRMSEGATMKYMETLNDIQETAKESKDFKDMVEALGAMQRNEIGDEVERQKKKRKTLKNLKMYTGSRKDSVDREDREAPPCRGWSVEAVKHCIDYKKQMEQEAESYAKFSMAFRAIMKHKSKAKGDGGYDNRNEIEDSNDNDPFDDLIDFEMEAV